MLDTIVPRVSGGVEDVLLSSMYINGLKYLPAHMCIH